MWKLCGRSRARWRGSVLEDVAPIGVLAALGVDVGTERIDLETLRPRIFDKPAQQGQGNAAAAQTIIDAGVLGDNEAGAGAAKGELALAVTPCKAGNITAARCGLIAAYGRGNCRHGALGCLRRPPS